MSKYKNLEKRKAYLFNWRKTNRPKIRDYFREYLRKKKNLKHPSDKLNPYLGTSLLGRKYELLALKLLRGSVDRNKQSFHGKWDIEWNGMRVDVKMRNIGKERHYLFTQRKDANCDYYLLFCVDKDNIKGVYLVPFSAFKKRSFYIYKKHPPEQFLINFSSLTD